MSPEQFLQLANLLPEALLLVQGDGIVRAANRLAGQSLAVPPSTLVGQRLQELVVDSSESVAAYLRCCSRSRTPVLGSLAFRAKLDGVGSDRDRDIGNVFRSDGSLLSPGENPSERLLVIRLVSRQSAIAHFVALNRRIQEQTLELARRGVVEQELRHQRGQLEQSLNRLAQVERRRAARLVAAQVLAQETTIEEGLLRLLEGVCQALAWDLGACWTAIPDSGVLRCLGVWHRPQAEIEDFAVVTRRLAFPRQIGLPGRVWAERRPVWIPDVVQDPNFPRSTIAARKGLHAAFAVPILLDNEVVGVLEFFNRDILEPDPDLLETMASVGALVGQFLHRKQTEGQLREEKRIVETLLRIGQRVMAELDLERLLQVVTDEATALTNAELGVFRCCWESDRPAWRVYSMNRPRDAGTVSRTHELLESQWNGSEILRLSDATRQLAPSSRQDFENPSEGFRSCLAIPVASRPGEVLGGLMLFHSRGGMFSDRDERLVVGIAQQAAIALENARLLRRTQEAARRLAQVDRRKSDFLAVLAHELRNPLAPIAHSIQYLQEQGGPEPELREARDEIARLTRHLSRLVDDLLDISRIDRGKIELRKEVIDLAVVVRQAVQTSRLLVEERKHTLTVELPSDPLPLLADAARLEQVLTNLLNNAARYTPPGGSIDLICSREVDEAVIRVRDTGIGMEADQLRSLFEPFAQAEHRMDRTHGGLGVGLSLVRSLVQLHQGTVSAHSAGAGQGSEFVVRLPLGMAVLAPSGTSPGELNHEAETRADSSIKKILVVDDNEDAARSLSRLLRARGYEVTIAHDGPTALTRAGEVLPQAVLLDLGLPGMDGCEVARQLRAQPSLQPVLLIALTGWGQAEDRERTQAAGFDHHLVKPADLNAILRLLNQAN